MNSIILEEVARKWFGSNFRFLEITSEVDSSADHLSAHDTFTFGPQNT